MYIYGNLFIEFEVYTIYYSYENINLFIIIVEQIEIYLFVLLNVLISYVPEKKI